MMVIDEGGSGCITQRRDRCADKQGLGERGVLGRLRGWDGVFNKTGKKGQKRGKEVK